MQFPEFYVWYYNQNFKNFKKTLVWNRLVFPTFFNIQNLPQHAKLTITNYYNDFINDHKHLTPYRTEWTIYDEDVKIAGSIDMVYENPDGTLSIYDWKRAKNITRINNFNKFAVTPVICHLPDSNFWHYALQLNTYKYILETKYGKTIKDLFLVRLHPDAEEKNYELIQLPNLTTEITDLFQLRIENILNENK